MFSILIHCRRHWALQHTFDFCRTFLGAAFSAAFAPPFSYAFMPPCYFVSATFSFTARCIAPDTRAFLLFCFTTLCFSSISRRSFQYAVSFITDLYRPIRHIAAGIWFPDTFTDIIYRYLVFLQPFSAFTASFKTRIKGIQCFSVEAFVWCATFSLLLSFLSLSLPFHIFCFASKRICYFSQASLIASLLFLLIRLKIVESAACFTISASLQVSLKHTKVSHVFSLIDFHLSRYF